MKRVKKAIKYILIFILFIVCFSLIRGISKLTSSSQKVTDQKMKVDSLKEENIELSQKLAGIESPQFIEEVARDKLGLAKKGEIVVVLPDQNTLRLLAPKLVEEHYVLPIPNWQLWLKLFM